MTVFSKHPYSFITAGLGLVLIAFLLSINTESLPQGATTYVSGGEILVSPTVQSSGVASLSASDTTLEPPAAPAESSAPKTTPAPPSVATNPESSIPAMHPAAAPEQSADGGNNVIDQVYSLIPSSFSVSAATPARTPSQQGLYDYGNQAGLAVLTFENAHADMGDVLNAWVDARSNPIFQQNVRSIAQDMIYAGDSLTKLTPPDAATGANRALALAFQTSGASLLQVVASGGSDDSFVDAIKSYDALADGFTTAYLGLSTLFSVSNVTFSASDPGSVFQFSTAGSL